MPARLSGYRLAARLARREVRRRPGRTALVALLVAFPVAAMVVAVVTFRTDERTPIERWRLDHGNSDALLSSPDYEVPGRDLPKSIAELVARSTTELLFSAARLNVRDARRTPSAMPPYRRVSRSRTS